MKIDVTPQAVMNNMIMMFNVTSNTITTQLTVSSGLGVFRPAMLEVK